MTLQEIFDRSTQGIIDQGCRPAVSVTGACMYRAPQEDGSVLKCAFGHLIPNSFYYSDMENRGAEHLLSECPNLRKHLKLTSEGELLIARLQNVHDWHLTNPRTPDVWNIQGWKNQLRLTAERFDLNTKILDKIPD